VRTYDCLAATCCGGWSVSLTESSGVEGSRIQALRNEGTPSRVQSERGPELDITKASQQVYSRSLPATAGA